jgi:hypothetical protein
MLHKHFANIKEIQGKLEANIKATQTKPHINCNYNFQLALEHNPTPNLNKTLHQT